ncbi:hypothetical protein [Luteimonas aquatica]|uniref:hypothetical protein n=1 Tax=Luteimonas aquatica TaxID=450364 RepID=UPI001F5A5388|nr:hypothetical protein [Luteimonas aquatica]
MFARALCLSAALVLSAGACTSALARAAPLAAVYVDAIDYLRSDAELEAWDTLRRNLKRNFDDICGDTFCEGEYGNIESLGFRCSVLRDRGRIGGCVWVFAASNEEIDPASGAIAVDKGFWSCQAPLAPGTGIHALLRALQGGAPMDAPLPGSTRSLYDGLIDCL